jgi:hypothetical protein
MRASKPKARFVTTEASNERFVARVKSMSVGERVGYMMAAGIFTKDGKLTAAYRD